MTLISAMAGRDVLPRGLMKNIYVLFDAVNLIFCPLSNKKLPKYNLHTLKSTDPEKTFHHFNLSAKDVSYYKSPLFPNDEF